MEALDGDQQRIALSRRPLLIGVATRPHPRETVNGDQVHLEHHGATHRIAVIDGLGHGLDAAAAAASAVDTLAAIPDADVPGSIRACHEALKRTRGAALSILRIDLDAGRLTFAGLGNVEGVLVSAKGQRSLIGAPCVCVDVLSARFGAHRRRTCLARPSRTRMRTVPSGGPGGRNRPQEEAPRRAAQ